MLDVRWLLFIDQTGRLRPGAVLAGKWPGLLTPVDPRLNITD